MNRNSDQWTTMSNVKGAAVKPSQALNLGKYSLYFAEFTCSHRIRWHFSFSDVNQQKKFIRFFKGLGDVSNKQTNKTQLKLEQNVHRSVGFSVTICWPSLSNDARNQLSALLMPAKQMQMQNQINSSWKRKVSIPCHTLASMMCVVESKKSTGFLRPENRVFVGSSSRCNSIGASSTFSMTCFTGSVTISAFVSVATTWLSTVAWKH